MNAQDQYLTNLFFRFMHQSASDYLQIEYIRENGFLGISGFKMPMVASFLNIESVHPSKYAIAMMFPSKPSEFLGAAGGMSLTNLYYIMGWFSVPVFFVFVFIFGYIDKIIINSIYNPINGGSFYFNISFYTVFIYKCAISIGSSIWLVFGIPAILSRNLFIMMIIYFIIIKVPCSLFIKKRLSYQKNIMVRANF